jgi:prolyl 4-hydroxylase
MNKYNFTEQIFSIKNILSKKTCQMLIKSVEDEPFLPSRLDDVPTDICKSPRNRVFIENEELASLVWKKIYKYLPKIFLDFALAKINPQFRFYKYLSGQEFQRHQDIDFVKSKDEKSFLSILIYLNDDFQGGETIFDNISIKPEMGCCLIFPHTLFHAGSPVMHGNKYVLRSDVIFKRFS